MYRAPKKPKGNPGRNENGLITVDIRLIGTFNLQTKVFGLDGSKLGQLGIDVVKVKKCDLLVEDLRKNIDANFLFAGLSKFDIFLAKCLILGLVQGNLCENLVGEGARHDKG